MCTLFKEDGMFLSRLSFYLSDMNVRRKWDHPEKGNKGKNDYNITRTNNQMYSTHRSPEPDELEEGKLSGSFQIFELYYYRKSTL